MTCRGGTKYEKSVCGLKHVLWEEEEEAVHTPQVTAVRAQDCTRKKGRKMNRLQSETVELMESG